MGYPKTPMEYHGISSCSSMFLMKIARLGQILQFWASESIQLSKRRSPRWSAWGPHGGRCTFSERKCRDWFLMIPDDSWLGHIRSMLRRKMTISWNRLRISFEDQWIRKVLRHVEENHHSSWLPVNSNCWNMIHGFFFGTISVPSGKLTVCYWKWP